jgi:exosortase A
MSSGALGQSALPANGHRLQGSVAALAFGLLLLGLLFHAESIAAVRVWRDSTAYNHCFLIIPIAGYLIWDRREVLRELVVHPLPWIALLALPLATIWLLAERLGIMEGRQLVVVTLLQLLVLAVMGWRFWWALSGPLLYLYFLVPFGEFVVPRLQDVTTELVRYGLEVLHVPAFIDGYVIEIPEGTFFIAEACAGLRFLIASIAFGCLYALVMYRSPGRRGLFILASIVIPVVANGLRAVGIIWLGHVLGSAQAAAADHVIYGWLFFSFVIILLIVVGLPFREDDRPASVRPGDMSPPDAPTRAMLVAVLALVSAAGAGPVVAAVIDRGVNATGMQVRPLDLAPGCTTLSAEPATAIGVADRLLVQHVVCASMSLELRIAVFSTRSTAAALLAERRRLTRVAAVDEAMLATFDGVGETPVQWRLVQVANPAYAIASAIWVDGLPAAGGLAMRARMAWHSLTGGQWAPVIVTVTPLVDWPQSDLTKRTEAISGLVAFLRTERSIDEQVKALSASQ